MKNKTYSVRNLILISLLLTKVAFSQTSTDKEMLGNQYKTKILSKINRIVNSFKKDLTIGKLHSIKAKKLTFSGSSVSMTFNAKLKRLWLSNQKGEVRLKAKVDSITDKEICISNVRILTFKLTPSWRYERILYKRIGKPYLKKATRCVSY